MFLYRFLSIVAVVFLFSCNRNNKSEHSFYYWKTSANFDSVAVGKMKKLGVGHLYLHYFDVDWNEALKIPVPKGVADDYNYRLPQLVNKYTPVIFITNRTFERMNDAWCDSLAQKVTRKIREKNKDLVRNYVEDFIHNDYKLHTHDITEWEMTQKLTDDSIGRIIDLTEEIQIDCDWTSGTRDKYFRFLRKFKDLNPGTMVSATIRLYPYKYKEKMGVPPVDKGMLMCYNLGNITSASTRNSVFDISELKAYLGGTYPLPVDIALPAFGWHVWFRAGKYQGIVHGGKDMATYGSAFQVKGNICKVVADTVVDDNYYREGDELRAELPDEEELVKAAALLTSKLPGYRRIAFFDWSDLSTTRYEQVIQQVFDRN